MPIPAILRRTPVQILIVIFLFGYFLTTPVLAQLGLLLGGRRPVVLETRYDYYDHSSQHQVLGTFARMMPLGRGGGSPFSHLTTLELAGGYRFNADTSKVRWKIAILDGDFQRKNLMLGLTAFDFDESGTLEENYRWFALRLGPAARIRAGKLSIYPNLFGEVGQTSMVLGEVNYGELGGAADSSLSGLQAGFRAQAAISVGRRIWISGGYGENVLVDAFEPHFRQANASFTFQLVHNKKMGAQLFVDYSWEKLDVSNSPVTVENQLFRAGVSFLLIPQRRQSQFDDF